MYCCLFLIDVNGIFAIKYTTMKTEKSTSHSKLHLYEEPLIAGYAAYIDYDIELEKAVLGVCLGEPRAYSKVYGLLTEDCFYNDSHMRVMLAIQDVWKDGNPVDLITVSRRLYEDGITHVNKENTFYYLSKLCYDVVNSSHLSYWCLKLRELAARRMMIQMTSTRFCGIDVLEGAESIQCSLQKALLVRHANDWQNASTAAMSLTQHIDDVMSNKEVGISTGFPTLDSLNGGFRAGQLVVLGARPSVGKSAMMGGIALGAARKGYKVGVFSLEMTAKDIFGRMVSSETGVPFAEMDRHGVSEQYKQQIITNSVTELSALPLYFSDAAQCTIQDIRAKAEQLKQRHGLDILLLDYLQLVEETDKYRSREQGIAQISRGLKMLAMNLEIPVIAVSQLNRESEHRANKKPTMADLRESGAIEQDADIVMLLHRDWRAGITEDAYGNSTEQQADLLIYKWRNGSPADLKLRFEAETMNFSEAA